MVASLSPIGTPLSFAGFPAPVIERLEPDLLRAGLVPVQAGVAGKGQETEDTLVPGAAVAVKLVKGDVEISAVGTVTYRDGDRLLAFGHPLLNLGPTSMPIAGAVVHALLPSLSSSFKIASPASGEIGSIQQDRVVAIAGSTSAPARMIPVRVEMSGNTPKPQRFAFEVMEDSFLTPYLIYASLNGILSSAQKDYGEVSVRLQQGSVIKVAGEEDINLNNLFAGDLAPFYTSGTVAYISQMILNNEYHPARISGINLLLEYSDSRLTARVERVWCGKDRVKPGEKVSLTISLQPYRGEEITRTFELTIPEELTPGKVMLQVGDGQTVSRKEEEGVPDLHPRDLPQLIWLINRIRPNDRLYVILTRPDNGIFFQGTRMPDLPPSKALVMIRPQTEGNFLRRGIPGNLRGFHSHLLRHRRLQDSHPGSGGTSSMKPCRAAARPRSGPSSLALLICLLSGAGSAYSVSTVLWVQDSTAEFEKGKPDGVAVSPHGEILLARTVKEVQIKALEEDAQPFLWSQAMDSKGNLFVGSGNEGRVYKVPRSGAGSLFYSSGDSRRPGAGDGLQGQPVRWHRPRGEGLPPLSGGEVGGLVRA